MIGEIEQPKFPRRMSIDHILKESVMFQVPVFIFKERVQMISIFGDVSVDGQFIPNNSSYRLVRTETEKIYAHKDKLLHVNVLPRGAKNDARNS